MLIYLYCFFFFKQKTAYDMRISDWSSDVCSSDLYSALRFCVTLSLDSNACSIAEVGRTTSWPCVVSSSSSSPSDTAMRRSRTRPSTGTRSEEHTSELQSLMRISSAVFCLKKKTTKTVTHTKTPN